MKKTIITIALLATIGVQNGFAQETEKNQSAALLPAYYGVKDALVTGNANAASAKAEEFVKILNGVAQATINDATRNALLKDANYISETKDLRHQREYFASFSENMYKLAKAVKLTSQPVYYDFCTMKKTHWLSSEATIKNPYFGSAMITCGKVEETLK